MSHAKKACIFLFLFKALACEFSFERKKVETHLCEIGEAILIHVCLCFAS